MSKQLDEAMALLESREYPLTEKMMALADAAPENEQMEFAWLVEGAMTADSMPEVDDETDDDTDND